MAIFSLGDKSMLGGAQFLHKPIPYLNDETAPKATLTYRLVGTPTGYQQKVYGASEVPFVSMQRVKDGEEVPAWSLLETYDTLWGEFGEHINVQDVTPVWLQTHLDAGNFSAVVCTMPRHALCFAQAGHGDRPHSFLSQTVRIRNEAVFPQLENTIIYDGTDNVTWTRSSMIFGVGSTEWGDEWINTDKVFPYKTVVVRKPLVTDCTCFSDQPHVVFTGRFGAWKKGVLTHQAFVDTWLLIQDKEVPSA